MEFLGMLGSSSEEEKGTVEEPKIKKRRTLTTDPESGTSPRADRAAASPRHAPAVNSTTSNSNPTATQTQQNGFPIPSTSRGEIAFSSNGANVYKIG